MISAMSGRPQRSFAKPRRAPAAALIAAVALAAVAAVAMAAQRGPLPRGTHLLYRHSRIVPIPDAIPHDPGDRIDKRLRANLSYLADRFPSFYVIDGYAGKPHERFGEHPLGLAVDVVPADWDGRGCDGSWRQISRIARWAEPRRNRPRPPFRWVGYNHDRDHGCGDHLHLSWNHAVARPFHIADWVEVFDVP